MMARKHNNQGLWSKEQAEEYAGAIYYPQNGWQTRSKIFLEHHISRKWKQGLEKELSNSSYTLMDRNGEHLVEEVNGYYVIVYTTDSYHAVRA